MKPLKPLFIILLAFSLVLPISSVFGSSVMWSQFYGTAETGMPYALVETSNGGYAIAGGQQALGVSYDFWLVKTDENGSMQWNQTYGGNSADTAYSMVETPDGGYALAGGTYSFGAGRPDFWLVKTDENGNMLWNRTYGGSGNEDAYSLVLTTDGGLALAGYTNSFGAGSADFWLIKTDANGNIEWSRTYGGTQYELARSVTQTSDGGYALAGYKGIINSFGIVENLDCWLIKTDSNGNMEWNQTYGGTADDYAFSLVKTFDGGYALAGRTWSFGAGKSDVWLIKTDSQGNMEWNQTYGKEWDDSAYSLVETSDRGYALAGYITTGEPTTGDGTVNPAGVEEFWLIKTDGSGNLMWNQTYGGEMEERAESLIETSDGGYAIAGYSFSHPPGTGNCLVIKTNESGYIPEFPSWTLLIAGFLITILVSMVYRRRIKQGKI